MRAQDFSEIMPKEGHMTNGRARFGCILPRFTFGRKECRVPPQIHHAPLCCRRPNSSAHQNLRGLVRGINLRNTLRVDNVQAWAWIRQCAIVAGYFVAANRAACRRQVRSQRGNRMSRQPC